MTAITYKYVRSQWDTTEARTTDFVNSRNQFLQKFDEDTFVESLGPGSTVRRFKTEAAAQEFIDFMVALAQTYNRTVTFTISDTIPSE
jgi:hypothetical protein